jgi:hypothetical protein
VGVGIEDFSLEERSDSSRSGGGGVLSRLSSDEPVERGGNSDEAVVELEVSVTMLGALERATVS